MEKTIKTTTPKPQDRAKGTKALHVEGDCCQKKLIGAWNAYFHQ